MARDNTPPAKYDAVAQLLHWSMAIMLAYLIFFSQFEAMPEVLVKDKMRLHSGIGLLIIFLGVFRWYWRKHQPQPVTVTYPSAWQGKVSRFVHHAFYTLFLISPLLGMLLAGLVSYEVRVFGLFEISSWLEDSETKRSLINSLHGLSADIMLFLLVLHIAAALYHQFIIRNNLLHRMTPYK